MYTVADKRHKVNIRPSSDFTNTKPQSLVVWLIIKVNRSHTGLTQVLHLNVMLGSFFNFWKVF